MDSFTIDPSCYSSPERVAQEWESLWTQAWHPGPRVEELPESGDGFLHTFGNESLIFLRQSDGSIKGFFNVCPHRGNRLLLSQDDGPVHQNGFNCAFHGWQFDRSGQCTDIPYRERFQTQDGTALANEDVQLTSFPVVVWAGWVWFSLAENPVDFSEYMKPIQSRLDAYQMHKATIVDYKTLEFPCNWKTIYDAFNESYHFLALHSDILSWGSEDAPITQLGIHSMMVNRYGQPSALYPDQTGLNDDLKALLQQNGIDPERFEDGAQDVRTAIQKSKRKVQNDSVFPYSTLTDSQLTDAYHYAVFPSVHFNLFPEFYVMMRYRPHPSGDAEKMYFDFIMCAPLQPGEEPHDYEHRVVQAGSEPLSETLDWGSRSHPIVEKVLGEDVSLVGFVQKGTQSMAFKGPILGEDEKRLTHFHGMLDQLIAGRASIHQLMQNETVEASQHSDD